MAHTILEIYYLCFVLWTSNNINEYFHQIINKLIYHNLMAEVAKPEAAPAVTKGKKKTAAKEGEAE